jgi:hypothetical protein
MHCETFKVYRKQLGLQRHRPERIAHLLGGPRRPYGNPGNFCLVEARAVLSEGDPEAAMALLRRAARLRPRLLIEPSWITTVLSCLRQVRRMKRISRDREAP